MEAPLPKILSQVDSVINSAIAFHYTYIGEKVIAVIVQ